MASIPADTKPLDLLGSATAMAAALDRRQISAEELLDLHLRRVAALNPAVNAVVHVHEETARAAARRSDARRARGETAGPLDGLPLTVKDNIRTAGLRTTAGVPFLTDHVPDEDADAIARIRAAGGIIFGKTNLPPMAGDLQSDGPLFGLTRNPWKAERTAGGSSGGSAAALAMGFTPLELGSDIAGSVRLPAHACGIYGHKPTLDVIPERGHIPPPPGFVGGSGLGTIGPMARSAEDLELLFEVVAGDPEPQRAGWHARVPAPRHRRLEDFRIALWADDPLLGTDAETRAMMDEVAETLERSGVRVDRAARPFDDVEQVVAAYRHLVIPFLSGGLPDEAVADAGRAADAASPAAATYLRLLADSRSATWAAYAAAREVQARTVVAWRRFFERFDALLCPVMPTAAYPHTLDGPSWGRTLLVDGVERPYWDQVLWCGALANFAFLPATARPMRMSRAGVPMGFQIVGPFMEDRTPLRLAGLLDRLFGGFVAPPAALAVE